MTRDGETARDARARNGALVALALLAVLIAIEMALRLAAVAPSAGALDPASVFVNYPLTQHEGYVTLRKGWQGDLWGIPFRMNRHGFRSPPVRVERRPDSLRVLLLGSCITLGGQDGTREGFSAFSSSLEAALQGRYPELSVEVLNAGVPGSFELQNLVYWREELARFQPDIVVLESGTSQIIEPGVRQVEFEARAPGADVPAIAPRRQGVRERLYDLFSRSVVISHFYAFRRAKEALFGKYFYRRPVAVSGQAGAAEAYVAEVFEPGGEAYRRDLSLLVRELQDDGATVVIYTFSHRLPDAPLEDLSSRDREALRSVEVMLQMPGDLDATDVWRIFRHAYAQVTEINRQVAAEEGAAYFDLQRQLRSPRDYDPSHYYLSNTTGAERKGRLLARFIMQHYDTARRRPDGTAP